MRSDRTEDQPTAEAPENQDSEPAPEETNAADRPEAQAGADGGDLRAEFDALKDRYLRLAAEYDNYRKRTERERSDAAARAQAQLVERLLDPLDDLQRVAHFSAETTTVQALHEGVEMVERKLFRVLENAGLEVIDAHGQPFDPTVHEALMTAATGNREEDESVGQVFQTGYRFRGELLRPARVQVRKFDA
ncbi:MAG TPA: nucleotide exchange factor GrpE [Longimicrobiaceae bacterium]|jgi:molecular chaperone GrpE|nr:nucleotide exchange factor GrpE [Longimicrobiaceae bacterium]